MARLGCKCGHTMGGSECPSPYSLYVYYSNEVETAMAEYAGLRLMDFIMNWDEQHECRKDFMNRKEPVEYWYCTECGRVYELQALSRGHWLRVYSKMEEVAEPLDKDTLVKLYVFSDVYCENILETDPDILLSEFVQKFETDYFVSEDERVVYAFNKNDGTLLLAYKLEEVLPSKLPENFDYQEYTKGGEV